MIVRRWGELCFLAILHILGTEGAREYIYEEGCLLEHHMTKKNILSTKKDKLNLIIAKADLGPSYISTNVKGNENKFSLTDNLPKTFPSGLVPVKMEFLEKRLTLVSLDKENPYNWTSDVSLKEHDKIITVKNVYIAKDCSQDLPYQKLAEDDELEVIFPLSQDREQRFMISLVKKATVQFHFDGPELHLCWDQKEEKAFVQNVMDENCNALPILSPLTLNFFLNSSSHKVKVTNMNTSSLNYSNPRVTFTRGNNKVKVYVVQCLKECPKEAYTCNDFMEGTPTELLISLVVILSIACVASVSVIIYQCKRQRAAEGAQVVRDRETNAHGDFNNLTASREFFQ